MFKHSLQIGLPAMSAATGAIMLGKVTFIRRPSGSLHSKWISQYLRYFLTEMAEIWSPGTFFEDVRTHKISALYLLYFLSYHNIYWKSLNKSLKVL